MKRSLIAFVTIAVLVALASCRGTTAAPLPWKFIPDGRALHGLTGAWVAEEPWIKDREGEVVGTVHYKLTFTKSRFIHNTFGVESADPRYTNESNDSGTWRADETIITKVAWEFPIGGEPPFATEFAKSYRFEDDGATLVMTHWGSERRPPIPTMRELRYTRVPETPIIGSWAARVRHTDIEGRRSYIERSLQVLEDGTFSFVQTTTPDDGSDATTISAEGRYTDDPDENFITLSDVILNGAPVPTEGMRFAYASGYGDNRLSLSAYWTESDGRLPLWRVPPVSEAPVNAIAAPRRSRDVTQAADRARRGPAVGYETNPSAGRLTRFSRS